MKGDLIKEQIANVVAETNFDFLGTKYEGKVRDSYSNKGVRYLITTDRLSCFDKVVTTVPFKGQTLNQMACDWFKITDGIIPNHIIDTPDPNVMVARECEILPIEIIIRGYITGSAWRDYSEGKEVSGIKLPEGLRNSQRLPELIVTPSTKAKKGEHDLPISEEEILSSRIVEPHIWQQAKEVALSLFKLGQEQVSARGLILVDTKYEFGLLNGKLILADEIHTMDSSRYWIADTYEDRFANGEPPQMLDKEPTRQWLLNQGYKGDGAIPHFTDQHRVEIAQHYIGAYEKITGHPFEAEVGPAVKRIEENLRRYVKKGS